MKIPDEFGLGKGWIYEVVVTAAGNAAPMGILTRDSESIELEIYKGSKTCENILRDKKFVINFVDDIEIFYNSIFEKERIEFEDMHLKDVDAFIEVEVSEVKEMDGKVGVKAVPLAFGIIKAPRPLNRAKALVLESLVAKTKIPHVSAEEREFLERGIQENLRVVRKVAPGSEFERILERL